MNKTWYYVFQKLLHGVTANNKTHNVLTVIVIDVG